MTRDIIEKQQILLEQAGATNVSSFIKKLRANSNNTEVFEDLLFESRAAMMFLMNGFSVEMRESPDLSIKFADDQFFAEVKHFRLKKQDRIDQANMEVTQNRLIPYGDTVPLEDDASWDQVALVAKRKTKQFQYRVSNILVIGSSSSHCIDDSIIPTAINIISEEVSKGNYQELEKLNGILLISPDYNVAQRRNVYFFPTHTAKVPLTHAVLNAFQSIRRG